MADYVATVVAALTSGWTPANTDSRTPTIAKIIEYTDFNLATADFCGVYAGDESETPKFVGYTGVGYQILVSFNLSTSMSHAHLVKLKDEARRVVHLYRKTLVTGALWHFKRAIDVSDKRRGTYKYVVDTLVDIPSELIT